MSQQLLYKLISYYKIYNSTLYTIYFDNKNLKF